SRGPRLRRCDGSMDPGLRRGRRERALSLLVGRIVNALGRSAEADRAGLLPRRKPRSMASAAATAEWPPASAGEGAPWRIDGSRTHPADPLKPIAPDVLPRRKPGSTAPPLR